MEEHPVPHNVLDIEFKLFGNFSIRQFARIMLGCALALGVYILRLPALISIPVILLALGYGIASAMIPKFDSRLTTILATLFISPRYVWKRTAKAPGALTPTAAKTTAQNTAIQTAAAANKISVNEFELDELLQARSERRMPPKPSEEAAQTAPTTEAETQFQQSYLHEFDVPAETAATLSGQINKLQKSGANPEAVDQVIQKIDQMHDATPVSANVIAEEPSEVPSQPTLYGVVVDQSDAPLSGVLVSILDNSKQLLDKIVTTDDGRFHTTKQIPLGEYTVQLFRTDKKFDDYRITVGSERLPAYKFRSK